MKKNEKGFSLVVVVIFMSIAALFVGYLLGSWLITFLVDDTEDEIAQNEVEEVQEGTLNGISDDLLEDEFVDEQPVDDPQAEPGETIEETPTTEEFSGQYGVQVGAFANYTSALALKNELEELGYEVFITDTSPHQIQVHGYESREDAEEAQSELETEGYEGFIIHRE
ncbi:SPOR domain-containing protein [Halanaerobium hydrogeniformans]|uniref:Sporulation domain-containing protein n=1 Tax=Halanaerobium hydrogeniformans TaxID=656519 RepID=E4RML5_HALHG|nr:SPOR domain-containing protein [Halanaerobium hydrogeniformans]ADQ14546.1 Sporulation domain-containing protein [Halanaerobium hydrogeniformans]